MFYPILSGKICLEQKIGSTLSNYYISIMQLQFNIPIRPRLFGTNLYKRMATQTWKEYIWQKVYETGPKKNSIYIQNS